MSWMRTILREAFFFGCCIVAVWLALWALVGCAATRATQTQALPDAPAGRAAASQPTREEFSTLAAQQNGLINAVSEISQRVELNSKIAATVQLNAKGVEANTNFGLAALATIALLCLVFTLVARWQFWLLWQDEQGDQLRERRLSAKGPDSS